MSGAALTLAPHLRARRAILCVLGASGSFSVAAALIKAVGPSVPVMEVVFFRCLVSVVAMLPLIHAAGGWRALRTARPGGHALRTAYGLVGMVGAFYGYAHLPLATVTALGFAMPLTLTALSVWLLRERVGWRRWTAVAVGLCGVLLVVRPWRDAAGELPAGPVLVVLAGVLAWALAMVSIRKLGQAGERNLAIVTWFTLGCTVVSAAFAGPVWVTPPPIAWALLVGVGLISALAQMLMTEGYRSGETTMVAPFEYGAILYATAFGGLFWGEWPTATELAGIAILIGSGLFIWWREAMLGVRRSGTAP